MASEKMLINRQHLHDDAKVRTWDDYANLPFNAWLQVTDEQPFQTGPAGHEWSPYLHVGNGDGVKFIGFKRSDNAGFVVPELGGRWWASWVHPHSLSGGWHHHVLGTYSGAYAAALAFDTVYALEQAVGNIDRMSKADRASLDPSQP